MILKFIVVVILYGYHATAIDFPYRCSIENSTCQQEFYQDVAITYAASGIPEIDVPPLIPFYLQNVIVPMEFLNATLIEGYCLGIGTCKLLHYESNLDNFHKIAFIQCGKIEIQGSYNIISTHPYFNEIVGNVSGFGNGTIVLKEWYFEFDYPFGMVKHEDGEIYTRAYFDEGTYVSKVLKNVTVTADNITLDGQDVTENVIKFLNEHGIMILETFGQTFHKISVDFYYEMYKKFFENVPASKYLSGDLEQYLPQEIDLK